MTTFRLPDSGIFARDDVPAVPGAYALVIRLDAAFSGRVGALGDLALPAGTYAYCGSAHGPGGIAARVRRHGRRKKRVHWHVDHLTAAGAITAVAVWTGGSECALVDRLLTVRGVATPIARFGASDCARCAAHLLSLPDDGRAALRALQVEAGLALYSAASLDDSAATHPSMV